MCPDEPIWPAPATGGGSSGPYSAATRRVKLSIGAEGGRGSAAGDSDILSRWHITLPVATTRWRLRINNGGHAGAITLTDLYTGTPTYTGSGLWIGNTTGAMTDVLAGLAMPSDGTDYATPWVSAAGSQFVPDVPMVLSLGITPAAGATQQMMNSPLPCQSYWLTAGTGVSGQVAANVPTFAGMNSNPSAAWLQIYVEYEYVNPNIPIVWFIGDSITAGMQDINNFNIPGPNNAWPALAAMRNRFAWVNAGVAQSTAQNWASGAGYAGYVNNAAWNDADLAGANAVPDFAVIDLGVNDAAAASSLANYQGWILSTLGFVKANGVTRIYGCTCIPQGRFKPSSLLAGAAAGATTLQTSIPYVNADSIAIDYENAQNETVTVSGASTGTQAPYTTTLAAATTKNHGQGAAIGISTMESRRMDYNKWWKAIPPGIASVFDRSPLMAQPGTINVPSVEAFSSQVPDTASVHPNDSGYQIMGNAIVLK